MALSGQCSYTRPVQVRRAGEAVTATALAFTLAACGADRASSAAPHSASHDHETRPTPPPPANGPNGEVELPPDVLGCFVVARAAPSEVEPSPSPQAREGEGDICSIDPTACPSWSGANRVTIGATYCFEQDRVSFKAKDGAAWDQVRTAWIGDLDRRVELRSASDGLVVRRGGEALFLRGADAPKYFELQRVARVEPPRLEPVCAAAARCTVSAMVEHAYAPRLGSLAACRELLELAKKLGPNDIVCK